MAFLINAVRDYLLKFCESTGFFIFLKNAKE
jgi:hypothetical protein